MKFIFFSSFFYHVRGMKVYSYENKVKYLSTKDVSQSCMQIFRWSNFFSFLLILLVSAFFGNKICNLEKFYLNRDVRALIKCRSKGFSLRFVPLLLEFLHFFRQFPGSWH